MHRSRVLALIVVLAAAPACDLVVNSGETLTLGGGSAAFGTNTQSAVTVLPGGTLVVDGAELFGRGQVVTAPPPEGQAFPPLGTAVIADRGTVRVLGGRLSGGNGLVQLGTQSTNAPAGTAGSAIAANGSTIEISDGVLEASSIEPRAFGPYLFASAVLVSNSVVRISGGVFSGGVRAPTPADPGVGFGALRALSSRIEITDGEFQGTVQLIGSRTRISGGVFSFFDPFLGGTPREAFALTLGPTSPSEALPFSGCTEIHGGRFARISVQPGEQLFIFGSFTVPLGRFTGGISLDVVYADGTSAFLPINPGSVAELRAPGQPGCDGL